MSAHITVVGLGTGDESQLTLGIWNKLQQAPKLYLRTEEHPVVGYIRKNGIAYESFDKLYEQVPTFEEVYGKIADRLVELARQSGEEIVYALPGHPSVAERTTQLLRQRCPNAGIGLSIMGGESFLDQTFLRFGFDPIEGFQLLDGTSLQEGQLNPALHTIIAQVYDSFIASDVKLTLMELYPDDYKVFVGHSLGVDGKEIISEAALYELDRLSGYGNLSVIWVPKADSRELFHRTFTRLRDIVAILRSPDGCPWDRDQTHASIRGNLIEETYEVLETIDDDDPEAMCEELGDLLLQVVMHAQMEEEAGTFSIRDVIQGLNDKLVRRHPHVFGESSAHNAGEALSNWQQMKQEEKKSKGIDPDQISILAGIPRDLPALHKAIKLQKRAAKVGFDWPDLEGVYAKIQEELEELREAQDADARKAELGDLLFAVVNLARFLKIDPEEALAGTNRKFMQRFEYIEEQLRLNGKTFDQTDLQEMEAYWQKAKKVL
ncbi:nucleoside triphosphate pyrophosphohydrolase [Paenibacillus sp. J2TS4]|uniref:nucleoside triphosphate pyrophosphohydrolase n=1 Tax=Paenibacillus sp. J2TS4 TaxID=2807194 RepID=UPI001B0A2C24|nr:nucleoside triphosphate pyrophosphohydrolase [Paenibacillus sp. J2TS4]GIP36341.1 MazG family protein [Paenibacillus sp. J2TS4]